MKDLPEHSSSPRNNEETPPGKDPTKDSSIGSSWSIQTAPPVDTDGTPDVLPPPLEVPEELHQDLMDAEEAEQSDYTHLILMVNVAGVFPSSQAMFMNFTVVRGKQCYGLIIDPGAARGLIGSDTLRDIIHWILKPFGKHTLVTWQKSRNSFTGISATPSKSLGMVHFPIGLMGVPRAAFQGDVLGGICSKCPGLVPLRSLQQLGCIIDCAHFDNGDGLLGIRRPNNQLVTQRLLLTDSGHLLMPIHYFGKKSDAQIDRRMFSDKRKLEKHGKPWRSTQKQRDAAEAVFAIGCQDESQPENNPESTIGLFQ